MNVAIAPVVDRRLGALPASADFPRRLDVDIDRAPLVDDTPKRDAQKPQEQRGRYRVLEDTQTLAGPRNSDP
jgi:hypothetical protein